EHTKDAVLITIDRPVDWLTKAEAPADQQTTNSLVPIINLGVKAARGESVEEGQSIEHAPQSAAVPPAGGRAYAARARLAMVGRASPSEAAPEPVKSVQIGLCAHTMSAYFGRTLVEMLAL